MNTEVPTNSTTSTSAPVPQAMRKAAAASPPADEEVPAQVVSASQHAHAATPVDTVWKTLS